MNDAPILTGTKATLANGVEDTAYAVTAAQLLQGFTDVDDATLQLANVRTSNGIITTTPTGYTITPAANSNGPVTITYDVTDGHGGTLANQTQTFTLAAVNDVAVIGGIRNGVVTEDATPNTVSGQLTVTDIDSAATFQPVTTATASTNGYGSFTFTAAGLWNFALNNANAAVNALSTSQTLSDSFVVRSADGTTQTISITINGHTDSIYNEIVGTPNQPTISGTTGADHITVGAGNFFVTARGGGDLITVLPSSGPHVIFGGSGSDTLDFSNFTANATIDLSSGVASGNTFFTSIGNAIGGSGDDTLIGNGSANRLEGGLGSDRITGRAGADVLVGNAGSDIFIFDDNDTGLGQGNRDVINDFAAGIDKLDLSLIDANLNSGSDQAFGTSISLWNGVGNEFAANSVGAIKYHYETVAGIAMTIIDFNNDNDRAADAQIALAGTYIFSNTNDLIL